MKSPVQLLVVVVRHLPPMEIRNRARDRVAARRPVPRAAGRLHTVLTSRLTHSVLLLAAAVANGLALGALQYVHELLGPLSDLTEALGQDALARR